MSKKFLISEEEKNYIINLYGNKGIVLNEQVSGQIGNTQFTGQIGKNGASLRTKTKTGQETSVNIGDSKSSFIYQVNEILSGKVTSTGMSNAQLLSGIIDRMLFYINKNKGLVDGKLDEESKQYWNQLTDIIQKENWTKGDVKKAEEIVKKGPGFYATPLVGDVCMKVTSNEVKRIAITRGETKGPDTTVTATTEYPSITTITPDTVQTDQWFPNNEWELTNTGKQQIYQLYIQPLIDIRNSETQKNKDVQVLFCAQSINIDSSCSRFKNTGKAANLSFEQLATYRANSANTYLLEQLTNFGVVGCQANELPKPTINPKGENGDGTSGPNPPTTVNPEDKGGQKSFAQYRYTKITVQYGINITIPGGTEQSVGVMPGDVTPYYTVTYFKDEVKYKQWKLNWGFRIPQGTPPSVKSGKKISCPTWNKSVASPSMKRRLPGSK